jgi:hypothetical protein
MNWDNILLVFEVISLFAEKFVTSTSLPRCTYRVNSFVLLQAKKHTANSQSSPQEVLRSFWPYEDGSHAAELPSGLYEAKLNNSHLQFLFLHCHHRNNPHSAPPGSPGSISFQITAKPGATQYEPRSNRFNYLPHAHTVDQIYTDNTARAFVGQGGATGQYVAYDIYTRRKPRLQVRHPSPKSCLLASTTTTTILESSCSCDAMNSIVCTGACMK